MAVRLIAGRAGCGKTHHCLTQIASMLEARLIDGPRLILLVPEQAGLQMERSLLTRTRARLLGRCEVLSFRRLAHRLLSDSAAPSPVVMTPIGRQMALRYLIGRHHRELTEFARVANRPGFVASISATLTELLQESASVEQLESAATDAQRAQHPSALRLHDVALLYRVYLEYLGSQRVDPEGVLDLARARLSECELLSGAHVWIDGFAGLTQQQQRMIVALARHTAEVQIALLMDDRRTDGPPDELSLFARTEQTWAVLSRALREAGVAIEPPLLLSCDPAPRFARSELVLLERNLFRDESAASPRDPSSPAGCGPVRYVVAPDRRAECAAAARAILDLVQAEQSPMRFRDIAVIVRDLEPYHDLLSAELAAHGIPFFIDRRRPTYHHPLVQWIRAALALLIDRRVDQTVCQLLKTGLVSVDPEEADTLENYLLAHGIEDAAAWDEPWK
jgi:ATP-dependent helicase/nuclease subunit B